MRRYVCPTGGLIQRHASRTRYQVCHASHSCAPPEFITSCLDSWATGSAQGTIGPRLLRLRPLPPSLGIFHTQSTTLGPIGMSRRGSHARFSSFSSLQQHQAIQEPDLLQSTTATTATATVKTPIVQDKSSNTSKHTTVPLKPLSAADRDSGTQTRRPWTPQQDEFLFDQCQRGVSWKKISATLQRPIVSCYYRYYRFLDPLLADAVEDEPSKEAEATKYYIEAPQRNLEVDVNPDARERVKETNSRHLPYSARGPWTAKDRERLESLIQAKTPWSVIAKDLERNQVGCKEKWFRIQRSRHEKKQQAMRERSELRARLAKEGFSHHHRGQLARAIETQLAARRTTTGPRDDPLALLGMDDRSDNSGTFAKMMGMHPTESHTGSQMNEYNVSPTEDATTNALDWVAIATALNNRFPAARLKSIYQELSAFKFIWTPEEDERLVRAVVRLGPPELQPNIWTMIKDASGDVFRTSEDYRTRWRLLDMPEFDRGWDRSEKIKFWTRWTEYQKGTPLFTSSLTNESIQKPLHGAMTSSASDQMWDQIAEGLEYRHGRDCELYFKRTTARFPKDPEVFNYLTNEVANVYLKSQKIRWSPQSSRLLVKTVNSFLQAKKAIRWGAVADALGNRYTSEQCMTRWWYWSQNQNNISNQEQGQEQQSDHVDMTLDTSDTLGAPLQEEPSTKPRLWTDLELELLKKGVEKYGNQWSDIRDNLLPHRSTQMINDRYLRSQAKRMGRFTEKERSLLETAIETFGEGADWGLIATQVPGRTASQCRQSWNYSRAHHSQTHGEPWTEQDRERLKNAVARFGMKKWTLVSNFVVGKTASQCRSEWQELDPTVKRNRWSGAETDLLMELVVAQMSREKKEEEESQVAAFTKSQGEKTEGGDGGGEDKDSRVQSEKIKFEDPMPRFKGKRRINWKEVAKGMDGRTAEQCRLRFAVDRKIYRIQGDF